MQSHRAAGRYNAVVDVLGKGGGSNQSRSRINAREIDGYRSVESNKDLTTKLVELDSSRLFMPGLDWGEKAKCADSRLSLLHGAKYSQSSLQPCGDLAGPSAWNAQHDCQ